MSHLVLAGNEELPSGLVLVSIVIDIERIVDYTKNIVEIAMNHPDKLSGGKFESDIEKIENSIGDDFQKTIDCFKNSDAESAAKQIKEYLWVSMLSDEILMSLVRGEEKFLSAGSAVAMALYVRSLKKINSHLRNVTSSVVNPFHRIGYKPKKKWLKQITQSGEEIE